MRKLSLLFTKDGLQWQISKSRKVLEEKIFLKDEDTPKNLVEENIKIMNIKGNVYMVDNSNIGTCIESAVEVLSL